MRVKITKNNLLPLRKGSALLIVLGFLSFMMISAVSFAIYMRIERQASSNYRHSTTARHMLNSALYRAIDEIDAELRVPTIGGMENPNKFPTNWTGRVRTSALANGDENDRNTRVISMEALSFIPGILVNDVRRYANPHKDDVGHSSSDATRNWRGAKWRTMENIEGVPIGRYAYLCVNVSDMLDINLCRATTRDSVSNRVSISHLFQNDAERQIFDEMVSQDGKYLTLQDFYASLYQRNDTVFTSPYHKLADPRNNESAPDKHFNDADNHVLISASRALPEPTGSSSPGINSPFNLNGITAATLTTDIITPLGQAVGSLGSTDSGHIINMIKDYLDEDSIPSALNIPTLEMVPMIAKLRIEPVIWNPIIQMRTEGEGADAKQIYSLRLLTFPNDAITGIGAEFHVGLMFPFRNAGLRANKPSFDVEVEVNLFLMHGSEQIRSVAKNVPDVLLKGTKAAPDFFSANIQNQNECFQWATVNVKPNNIDALEMDICDSDGTFFPPFVNGMEFHVAMVVYAYVKQGSQVVDAVPAFVPDGNAPAGATKLIFPKLYLESNSMMAAPQMVVEQTPYKWNCLETPDPRFNHNAHNWIITTDNESGFNASTTELLLKEVGCDRDVFMEVSDCDFFQSPGELGFIIRPGFSDPGSSTPNLENKTEYKDAADYRYMFRTIRLYDHGGTGSDRARDKIFENFIVANPDGTLTGARVNPLSDIPDILEAAIFQTPLNYHLSGQQALGNPLSGNHTFDTYLGNTPAGNSPWDDFVRHWSSALINKAKSKKISKGSGSGTSTIAASWQVQMRDVYGLDDTMGWYTDSDIYKIFNTPNQFSLPSDKPLHEVDRKMLYSFSLDSFCDRQQLFLYIIRAEVTSAALMASATEARSLAGGRAVALVWRDPYPTGYNPNTDAWLNQGASDMTSFDWDSDRISPWYQHHINNWDNSKNEKTSTQSARFNSFHEHKILFFKQLDK